MSMGGAPASNPTMRILQARYARQPGMSAVLPSANVTRDAACAVSSHPASFALDGGDDNGVGRLAQEAD